MIDINSLNPVILHYGSEKKWEEDKHAIQKSSKNRFGIDVLEEEDVMMCISSGLDKSVSTYLNGCVKRARFQFDENSERLVGLVIKNKNTAGICGGINKIDAVMAVVMKRILESKCVSMKPGDNVRVKEVIEPYYEFCTKYKDILDSHLPKTDSIPEVMRYFINDYKHRENMSDGFISGDMFRQIVYLYYIGYSALGFLFLVGMITDWLVENGFDIREPLSSDEVAAYCQDVANSVDILKSYVHVEKLESDDRLQQSESFEQALQKIITGNKSKPNKNVPNDCVVSIVRGPHYEAIVKLTFDCPFLSNYYGKILFLESESLKHDSDNMLCVMEKFSSLKAYSQIGMNAVSEVLTGGESTTEAFKKAQVGDENDFANTFWYYLSGVISIIIVIMVMWNAYIRYEREQEKMKHVKENTKRIFMSG